jgi:heptosyltransferase-2/heptosyltransferase-3
MQDETLPRPSSRERWRAGLLWLFRRLSAPIVGRPRRPSSIQRALIIRPDHLGDVLFAAPALERWRETTAGRIETTLSVGPWSREAAEHGPPVGDIEVFPYPGFTRAPKGPPWAPYVLLWREARRLRRRRYDLAVILRFDHWWAGLLCYLAGIPLRLGYDTMPLRHFLTHAVPYAGVQHEAQRNLALIEQALTLAGLPIGRPDDFPRLIFRLTEEEREAARRLLAGRRLDDGRPLVVLHPSAGAPVKEWPAERFAEVGDALARQFGAHILITGARSDISQAWKVAARMREEAVVTAGRTTLGQLAALLAESDLVIGADSGPLHLAVAVGTPTIHLFGPADPVLFGPWSDRPAEHVVIRAHCPCAPCNRLDFPREELPRHRCMETISTAEVLRAAEELLGARDKQQGRGALTR